MEDTLHKIFTPDIISSLIIGVAAIIACVLITRAFRRIMRGEKVEGERSSVIRMLFDIFRVTLIAASVIIILRINGINVMSLLTGLGIASAVIGLAMQDFIKDVIMGLYIVINHFYSVGECVEYQGREGIITSFNLKTTKIGDLEDHSIRTVCNRNISEIRRLSMRMDIDLPLSYGEDIRLVHTVLRTICKRIEEEVSVINKCEYLGTQSFENSAILYKIRLYCKPRVRPEARRAAMDVIQKSLNAANIRIPFNQLDVHIDPRGRDGNPTPNEGKALM